MTGFEQLERALRESVRERASRRRAWWMRGRRGVAGALGVVLVGGGAATATQLGVGAGHHGAGQVSARRLAYMAIEATRREAPCRPVSDDQGGKLTDVPLDPRLRPLLAGGGAPDADRVVLQLNHGSPVIAGSTWMIPFAHGYRALLYAVAGGSMFSVADRAGCLTERLAWVAKQEPDPSRPLRRKTEALLRAEPDTMANLQSLEAFAVRPHGGAGGSGMPMLPGRAVPVGLVGAGSGAYLGIARPEVVRVTADGAHVHRSVTVRHRAYLLVLPRGTGPVVLRQRTAAGRIVHTQRIRG